MRRRLPSRVRKLRSLRGRDLLDILRCQWALLRAQVLVWTRPDGHLLAIDHSSTGTTQGRSFDVARAGESTRSLPESRLAEVRRLSLALSRAARFGLIRPACLVRAVALQSVLEARGLAGSRIRIGVRREGTEFAAHAWVDYHGVVLDDSPGRVGTYREITDARVAPR